MNRRFQKKLAAYFTPPPPVGKAAFLARLPQPTLSLGQFVGGQARYIQKQTWLLSLVVLVLLVSGALSVPLDAISTLFMKLFNFIFMVPSSLRFIY